MTFRDAPSRIADIELTAVTGEGIVLPDPNAMTHIQFRRFAGCPICNLHLQSYVRRFDEISTAGIREVVFFHSTADELREHTADLPFTVIGDPEKRYYREFGVESSSRALLHPKVWWAIVYGTALTALGRYRPPTARQAGGRLGLPADFLVDPEGRVIAAKFGVHADDQWSVDDMLGHARRSVAPPA
jgi:peroxiredoxin